MLTTGIEPATVGLLDQCSTDWATRAWIIVIMLRLLRYAHNKINWGQAGIEPATSRTLNENHTTRPLAHYYYYYVLWYAKMKLTLPAGLEPATYRLTADRSANWAMEADMLLRMIKKICLKRDSNPRIIELTLTLLNG